jgi:hypothetical protein
MLHSLLLIFKAFTSWFFSILPEGPDLTGIGSAIIGNAIGFLKGSEKLLATSYELSALVSIISLELSLMGFLLIRKIYGMVRRG